MLDALIDVGIAVPIIAEHNGVLFRAYRHGEDALFADQEYALAFHIARGFLEGAKRDRIPRLTMEKLLVALVRVGVSRRFLTPHFGMDGGERVARIAFHRHGAVVSTSPGNSVFADALDSWLTRRLTEIGVLRREQEEYVIGSEPPASYIGSNAIGEARQLGLLLGMLNARREGSAAILGQRELTLLTTCPQARDTAGAVVAEFRLFDRWFRNTHTRLSRIELGATRTVAKVRDDLIKSGGYQAFNSALFKLTGYLNGEPTTIVETCAASFAAEGASGTFVARAWQDIWQPIVGGEPDGQRRDFETALGKLGRRLLVFAVGVFGIELALATLLLDQPDGKESYAKTCRKVLGYLEDLASNLPPDCRDGAYTRLHQRCRDGTPVPEPLRAFAFALDLIDKQLPAVRDEVAVVDEEVRRYARLVRNASFDYAFWFDIIDATGTRAGLSRDLLAARSRRIEQFKRRVNETLRGAMRDAQRQSARVAVVANGLELKEDEQHVLFAGAGSQQRMLEAAFLVQRTADELDLKVRMLLLPAGFAGSPPYEYHGEPAIEGQDFWRYGHELRTRLREQEGGELPASSLLWLHEDFAASFRRFPELRWAASPTLTTFELTVDARPLRVAVKGGPVKFPKH